MKNKDILIFLLIIVVFETKNWKEMRYFLIWELHFLVCCRSLPWCRRPFGTVLVSPDRSLQHLQSCKKNIDWIEHSKIIGIDLPKSLNLCSWKKVHRRKNPMAYEAIEAKIFPIVFSFPYFCEWTTIDWPARRFFSTGMRTFKIWIESIDTRFNKNDKTCKDVWWGGWTTIKSLPTWRIHHIPWTMRNSTFLLPLASINKKYGVIMRWRRQVTVVQSTANP